MPMSLRPARTDLFTAVLCLLLTSPIWPATVPGDALAAAHADFAAGREDDAIARLGTLLAANPGDAEAHSLLCRVFYQEEHWDEAIHECETAVQLTPNNSEFHLWLARAYGEKADSIHSIKAYGLAKKVHAEFERAVQLDPGNVDALADLGDFYAEAPGIVGGGRNKARAVVQALQERGPVQSHQLEGHLAEKEKKPDVAESEYQAAVATSKQSPDTWMALAAFYGRWQQWDKMLAALHSGIEADAQSAKPHGPALVDGALILARYHRDPQLAIQLLEQYLASGNQSAERPAFQVQVQLSRLLEQQGDHKGAQQHLDAAASLAHGYHPAAPRSAGQ